MLGLDLVYQYRKLVGKCDAGLGLDVDEIISLTALESAFAPEAGPRPSERRFRRDAVDFSARLRGIPGLNDAVRVTELGPGGLVCRQTPYLEEGQVIEVVIDDDEVDLSYRFYARVAWMREDDGDDFAIGLEFVGVPLLVHYGSSEHTEDAVDRITAETRAQSEPGLQQAA
jgi:hypothetical protein